MGLVLYLQKFQRPPRRLQQPRPQPLLKSQRRPRLQPQLLKVVLAQQQQRYRLDIIVLLMGLLITVLMHQNIIPKDLQ